MRNLYKPADAFNESFNDQVQRAIMRTTVTGWNAGTKSVRARFDAFSSHDLLGYERRAYIETGLLGVAQRFQFANARPQTNHAGNTFHVELIRGRVVLTASAVRRPQEMVREAIFRRTLARDPQRSFFDEDHPSVELPDDPLYGLVLYGPPSRRADQRFPGFVVVAFPDPQLRYYIDEVDLLNKFAHDHTELVLRLRRDEEIA